uniref:Activator of Hsp90 ATPase AHSA1-like N-terminal domain-containing protein n=1 Tax=Polytomella parva TaxID=51329 RepID=A0A7S0UUB9_9CHLO|eukprot:CAMPEP_0175059536 /NCGR_PEP_ID=MMETSP0052_2-20121109/12487_1 /TAXON_ID=51329 ORGANISM="Polytomella parva, Strain SAG 63-3" /NCGR_SAMPLE_ID=MMETSP0052_2 /ASSEMBLY_ACC=CAM_ASM_000194 /LENGTH=164 /DNA_ID=CAMNT_0016325097 /DNA_START=26 /DNA_END=520 /DNA_ORIENTATION=-
MAKWGEGDPRWLVEHRDDGVNVNGWHWTEKNIIHIVKEKTSELFSNFELKTKKPNTTFKIDGVKEITGDASITTRKGNKKFSVFDLKIILEWSAIIEEVEKNVKGTVVIEEVHSTGDEDDYVFSVTVEGSDSNQNSCKEAMLSTQSQVYATIAKLVSSIKELEK